MPVVEQALYSRLTASTSVTSLVSTRVYPVTIPQDPKLPAIQYDLISNVRESRMTADDGQSTARMQVTAWGRNYAEASNVSEGVRSSVQRWSNQPIVSHTATDTVASGTSHPINLSGSTVPGRLLLVFMALDDSASGWSSRDGFTSLGLSSRTGLRSDVAYKISTGGDTATWTTATAAASAHVVHEVDNWHGVTPPEDGSNTNQTGAAVNPASLTVTWDAGETTVWLAFGGLADGSGSVTAAPTGYSDLTSAAVGASSGAVAFTARRETTSATEDPGVFTLSSSTPHSSRTVGVRGGIIREVFLGNEFAGYDPESGLYSHSLDVIVHYEE